ncbi:AABR07012635.1 [Phodopus roborovskii]|uniref:AABR07012635.1 protein n=1 Tax=Phodopus roborovskii TaxID=109678 RepID=A0AAV0AEN3_PHORO|nr:AABR07012635.1 [Phodopus roborovskii]
MLQFTDPERLSNKEGPSCDTWISLERENRTDFLSQPMTGPKQDPCHKRETHVRGCLEDQEPESDWLTDLE